MTTFDERLVISAIFAECVEYTIGKSSHSGTFVTNTSTGLFFIGTSMGLEGSIQSTRHTGRLINAKNIITNKAADAVAQLNC